MAEIKVLGHNLFYRDRNQSDTIFVFLPRSLAMDFCGPGKHFLPFDAPQAVAHAIQDFTEE